MKETPDTGTLADSFAQERELAGYRYPLDETIAALQSTPVVVLAGVFGSWLSLVLTDIQERLKRPLVVIVPKADEARSLHESFSTFAGAGRHAILLPSPDVSPFGDVTPDRNVVAERMLAATTAENLGNSDILIASVVAWARKLMPHDLAEGSRRTLRTLDEVNHDQLRQQLLGAGYSAVPLVEDVGTFSMRGDRVDIFSPSADRPVRIEFYGDMIESMRWFDTDSQRGAEIIEEFRIIPVREELITDETLAIARERLGMLGGQLQIPSSRLAAVLRDLAEKKRFFGIEGYLPALAPALQPLADRIPADAVMVIDEPDGLETELQTSLDARRLEYEREIATGKACFRVEEFFVVEEELTATWSAHPTRIVAGRLAFAEPGAPVFRYPALDNQDIVRIRKNKGGEESAIRGLIGALNDWREWYGRIVVVTGSRGSADRIARLFEDHHAPIRQVRESPDLRRAVVPPATHFEIVVGDLRTGFRSPARGIALVTDGELLGRSGRKPAREVAHESTSIANFRELLPNDLIVHVDHGIGRYLGLERMDVGGYEADFLVLQYAENDKLYLPVYRLGRVQKYTGSATFTRLDKLGGVSWDRTKEKVKRQLADIAQELLQIQAERKTRVGFAFSAPDAMYHEFEARFPYEETSGQQQAIEEVLDDMMSARPMDRLLCGDVGFGKTEVAIRAAFKAVVDGKQVAILVPTTVLAEQHLKSFRERLSMSGARVECVSRFRTTAETREIMDATRAGRVDVLIGTHKLLSKELEFRDLGLVVIDEEQRFGVQHKERLKQLRATVDMLTMSATPIPRTLELSLLGIRDLSMITTPPAGRLAVRTHLAKFTESVVREAILNEIQRGGQVFFVHNRVETIFNVADRIAQMVPEAKVLVAHAQMRDVELEDVMMRFLNREGQVLVSTTIVESGLDVANANTIFINEAQNFGLSQLHQLRGRVGRGSDRAFCYLLVADPRKLTEEARRRLDVIQEHSDLGSGLQIAHQDLDLRGAGNVLGRDQSGHIESIGFELFSELLEEAVAELKGEEVEARYEPEVKIPVAAYIPDDYIEDVSQRLAFYKRFSLAESNDQLFDIHGEIEDRYGRAPIAVTGLRDIVSLKITMKRLGANRIEGGPKAMVVELLPTTTVIPDKLIALMETHRGKWEFRPGMVVVRHLKGAESTDMLGSALAMARDLMHCLPESP